ncbi:MAG: LPS-assembly protein LptD [Nitrospirae bacterium]|nr:LPS-assembly protein LptD [Nitrospirota bacterium]
MQDTGYKIQDTSKIYIVHRASCIMYLVLFSLFTIHYLLFTANCFAQEPINISAEYLEHFGETNTSIVRGSVKIVYEDAVLTADEVYLDNNTKDATAIRNVVYEDSESIITAERMEINLDTRLGTLYNSHVFFKSRNYHIQGDKIKKVEEETYLLDKASATTCDTIPPEWHFKGKDVKVTLHENIKAKDATFYVKGVPVLYTPYLIAPLLKERQTGLLMPIIGYSSSKGITYKQGFFWTIEDNRDATFHLDYYGKKGIGKGLDYRYIENPETNGELWMYHLKDQELKKDFLEFKSYHNQRLPYNAAGHLKLHFVNKYDYYDVIGPTSKERFGLSAWGFEGFGFQDIPTKYVESNLYVSRPFHGGRTYLMSKYRQSLEGSSETIPQYLPEIGFVIDTTSTEPVYFDMTLTGTNFRRDEGQKGQRLDIYPNVYFSTGKAIKFLQKVGLRETLYFLKDPAKNQDRNIFDLRSTLTTTLFKKYKSFTHAVEPSIEYIYIPEVDQTDIPVFDGVDSISEASNITYALTNRFSFIKGNTEAILRISQNYNFLNVERPFNPLLTEASLSSKNLDFAINTSYDVYDNRITEAIASTTFKWDKGFIGIGKSYRRSTSLDQYTVEAGINSPLNIYGKSLPMSLYGKLWYDITGNGIQEANFKTIYTSQCWAIIASYTRRPFEYQIMFSIEFRGFGSIKIG